jgi:hypothetical protein
MKKSRKTKTTGAKARGSRRKKTTRRKPIMRHSKEG